MLLPYVSYLRIYEPVHRPLPPAADASLADGLGSADASSESRTSLTLAREHLTVLSKTVSPTETDGADLSGCYLMRRGGRTFACAVDLELRRRLALTSFVEETDTRTRSLFFLSDTASRAPAQRPTRQPAESGGAPHIRSATWGVPRTWFLLVAEEERESYDLDGVASVRFRTPIPLARRRLARAAGLLHELIDDDELLEELADLQSWLASFDDDGWLEVDYAGVARLMGPALADDRSAADITQAVEALLRHDFSAAAEAYRAFAERWRAVNALERAN